jgi:signal transduction histidine kinase/CheY-like chemotaxis protein
MSTTAVSTGRIEPRAAQLFADLYGQVLKRTDRFFAFLMIFQWLFGIFSAVTISPYRWAGAQSALHVHVYAAVFLGGVLTLIPATLGLLYPGRVATRQVIAISQMLFSALLIHLSAGRIETHFHVFGSLAFLAFYRDWRVLLSASAVVALDHFVRGIYWPQSVYAVAFPETWRWLEHTAWVVFEDIFLIYASVVGLNELRALSTRQATLEATNERVESLRKQAESASDTKSAFLANVSHEIRTPLGAVLGFTQLLQQQGLDPTERRAYLDVIERNGHQLTRLIDDILDLSKVEAGQLQLESVAFPLDEIINDVTASLAVKCQDKALRLVIERTGHPAGVIVSDPTRLRQILLNVVGNAIKFTQVGSVQVTVHGRCAGDSIALTFTVKDSGRGMSAGEVPRLFRPFSQADASTTRKFGGTGLGLALSRMLARSLGGDLVLVDSQIGVGSTFEVAIVAGRGQAQRAGDVATPDSRPLQGLRILVAEDMPDNQLLFERILSRCGAHVDVVANGAEAERRAQEDAFDVVLMDIQMPVMDGHAATRALRRGGYSRPIIALTAHAMREEQERCRQSGCNGHLSKPISAERLIAAISQYACPSPT